MSIWILELAGLKMVKILFSYKSDRLKYKKIKSFELEDLIQEMKK